MTAELHLDFNFLSRLIRRCRTMKQLHQIHSHIITSPHVRAVPQLLGRLLFFCASSPSASLSYAAALFRSILHPDLFAYNAMLRVLAASASPGGFGYLPVYVQMHRRSVRPDHLTFPFLLRCCAVWKDLLAGRAVHAQVVRLGFGRDTFVGNTLISAYASCGLPGEFRQVFEEMPRRDVVSWNSMLTGYLRFGELDSALSLFLGMYERNLVTWNSIITGFVQGGRPREALDLFHKMQNNEHGYARPDKRTLASVVSACAALGALDQGQWVHGYMKSRKLEFDIVLWTALVDMYGKCGCLERSAEVFEQMPSKDVLAWTAMISSLAINGQGKQAFCLLFEMVENAVRPNAVTFGAILNACAHSGMVSEGRWCFDMMQCVYAIQPNLVHYGCMVDLLGRARLFEEAVELIRSMPMEPDVFVWGALLGACQMHGNLELGERIANHLIGLDPFNHTFYVILSDLYAKFKITDGVRKIWDLMKRKRIKKASPGCSMIEVEGRVSEFSVNGAPDISMEKIVPLLNGIGEQMRSIGHVFMVIEFTDISP